MDQNFQTSFIPKKPMIKERVTMTRSIGFLPVIALFILFSILLSSVGLYFYKGILIKNIAKMQNDLNLAKNRFEPSKIAELQVLDKILDASSEVLGRHMAISPIFQALQIITMKSVRYTKFDFSSEPSGKILVKISGMAIGYSSVALQSDLFAKNKNLINPIFSNLNLDEKGNVLFDLEFSIDPNFLNYKQMLLIES